MGANHYIGWDIGGAHLKLARVDGTGTLIEAEQFPVVLWQGMTALQQILKSLHERLDGSVAGHALTMTGELVDAFPDRETGVNTLADLFARQFSRDPVAVYAADSGLVPILQARRYSKAVASANWHATATFVAGQCGTGVLVDIGSTTTDIVPFVDGHQTASGMSDQERLRVDELVYTGVVRTPVMAIVRRVPFRGAWQNVAAELFATMADVYRIRQELDEACDQMSTADGAGKTVDHSIRRLARMLGTDPAPDLPLQAWLDLAGFIAERQYQMIETAFMNVKSRFRNGARPVLAGAGCGRFIARRLAARHNLDYVDFPELLAPGEFLYDAAATCATAVSLARLLQESASR